MENSEGVLNITDIKVVIIALKTEQSVKLISSGCQLFYVFVFACLRTINSTFNIF